MSTAIYSSRWLSYMIIVFSNFLCGIEYAIILPTAFSYIQTFDGNEFDFGICLSAYSFTDLLSSPVFGYLSDRTTNTKRIILFANLWQIIGSFIYFIGYNKWLIIMGRLTAGIGCGSLACYFAEVSKNTSQIDRAKVFAYIMMGRQIGLIIGPALNIAIIDQHFYIGPFYFNKLSAPGFLMAIFWLILEIVIVLFYKNLSEFDEQGQADRPLDEQSLLVDSQSIRIHVVDNANTGHWLRRWYEEYVREEVIAVFLITFTSFFIQTSLETLLTPLVKDYLNWGDRENSIIYACAGLEILFVFILLSYLSRCVSERQQLLIGLVSLMVSLVYLLVYIPQMMRLQGFVKVVLLLLPIILNVWSIPFIALGSVSILSKMTSKSLQGCTQGIRRSIVGFACILGPIWCGTFYAQWYILFGSLVFVVSLSLFMLLLSFARIKPITVT